MRRILVLTSVGALTAGALTLSSQATVDAAPGNGYVGYVACSTKASARPSHACKETQTKAAFFLSRDHDATFKVCVKYPGRPQRLCASEQQAPKGEKQFVTIATATTGRHTVSWYVGARKVATWSFRVTT